jgi:uncharacterized membrane protein YjjP (DUF1212 family)
MLMISVIVWPVLTILDSSKTYCGAVIAVSLPGFVVLFLYQVLFVFSGVALINPSFLLAFNFLFPYSPIFAISLYFSIKRYIANSGDYRSDIKLLVFVMLLVAGYPITQFISNSTPF